MSAQCSTNSQTLTSTRSSQAADEEEDAAVADAAVAAHEVASEAQEAVSGADMAAELEVAAAGHHPRAINTTQAHALLATGTVIAQTNASAQPSRQSH